jgi:hypothetical protein
MRKALVAVAFTASLLASPAGRPVLLGQLWELLSAALNVPSTDAGCGWDPFGRCTPVPQNTADEGCGMDPYGCPKGS